MRLQTLLLAGTAITLAAAANAAPITLTGNYMEVGISDAGTLGSDGNTSPGILHDPTGTQNFGVNDYLTPGTPHDSFSVGYNVVGAGRATFTNDNDFSSSGGPSDFGIASPTATTVPGFSLAATWTGTNGPLTVTNTYYFNPNDERVHVQTVITNTGTSDLTGVDFGRSMDPDPDYNTFSSYVTNNQVGDTPLGIASSDIALASGQHTGLTIGIQNESGSTYTHVADIGAPCCSAPDPAALLAFGSGFFNGGLASADNSINLAWSIGTLGAGASATIDYDYVTGANVGTIGTPTVPEPASLSLIGGGLAALGWLRRRRKA